MREALDFYKTPRWQVESLLRRVPIAGSVIEPCVGDGAISRVIDQHMTGWGQVIRNDIDPKHDAEYHLDATQNELWGAVGPVDYVVSNPPFNSAISILKHAYANCNTLVAFLLRLSFLEPTKESKRKGVVYPERELWLSANPPKKIIVLPRWKYKRNSKGTDSCTTAWMIWDKRPLHYTLPIEIVPKEEMETYND